MGRTARPNFVIRLDNASYSQADSFDLKCSDFQKPVAIDDSKQAQAGQPATLQILGNDGINNAGGVFSIVTPVTGFTMASVNLVPAAGATGIINDDDGDIMGFAIPGEGVWSYGELKGELTFVPQPGFSGSPTPILYTFRNATGSVSNQAKVTILYPELKIVKTAVPPAIFTVGATISYTFTVATTTVAMQTHTSSLAALAGRRRTTGVCSPISMRSCRTPIARHRFEMEITSNYQSVTPIARSSTIG